MCTTPKTTGTFSTSVYSCGYGEYGRLGLSDEDGRHAPELVTFDTGVGRV